jgi:maltose alpha-D-glucosyltransferase/alpha-amylase
MTHKSVTSSEWYKQAIMYGVDLRRFYDADGNGVGDIKGLIAKLDYLETLGVNCLWLLPFFTSHQRDNGYDIINYMDVESSIGDLADIQLLLKTAKSKGMHVIIDLVIHHTSDKHPWFIAATQDRQSKYKDYYIWADQLSPDIQKLNSFPTVEDGIWKYQPEAKAYYRHQFYGFEPDLNLANKNVQQEIYSIIDFWLALGVDGFRFDAATFILSHEGIPDSAIKPWTYFEALHSHIIEQNPEAILVGEADVETKLIPEFFDEGKRFQLLYNFMLNNALYLALAKQEAAPLAVCLKAQADSRTKGVWINFARNADELNLVHLSDEDNAAVLEVFAPDPKSQIYERGIRRRLPPMLIGNQNQIRMVYSLIFALPGIPMLLYGEEIGMGDDLSLGGRDSVRIPMQWNATANAGFSAADNGDLIAMANTSPEFGFTEINVEQQLSSDNSLLSYIKELIALRKKIPFMAGATCDVVKTDNPALLMLRYEHGSGKLFIIHNLSSKRQPLGLSKQSLKGISVLFGHDVTISTSLPPHGISWFMQSGS